jgi:DNA repair protein RadA/Sms
MSQALPITEVDHHPTKRFELQISELDRVLGGGLVPGSVILVGGEPGIGKSTLLITVAAQLAKNGDDVLYISGEESATQIRLSAERLGSVHERLLLLTETDLDHAISEIERLSPRVVILDSVQTVFSQDIDSASGSVSQIREVTARIVQVAKSKSIATFLVGHVTKEGSIAGPKLLEHMVDTVLYFESSSSGPYRFLRVHKNRFGSTREVGVFEMRASGLKQVSNPSEFFLSERSSGKPGSAVTATIEGTRAMMVEVQALCVSTLFGMPRRTAVGIDSTRCAILAAVLEKHGGIMLAGQDLFINVVGGVELVETSSDLSVALAVASSLLNKPLASDLVVFGEVGLSGEIRGVHRIEDRLNEAFRLGFKKAMIPQVNRAQLGPNQAMEIMGIETISQALRIGLEEFKLPTKK